MKPPIYSTATDYNSIFERNSSLTPRLKYEGERRWFNWSWP